jgi:3-methyladenine DNA glycosylase/8-oxoguanine DNA glycosylase
MENVKGKRSASLFVGAEAEGLPFDARAAVKHLAAADSDLGRVMREIGPFGLQLQTMQDPFGSLAESIVYQQLTGKAAATIFGRVLAIYAPKRKLRPADVLATPDEKLRGAGLSRAKTAALKDLAAKTIDGTVPTMAMLHALTDDAIVERLTECAASAAGRWR